MEAPTVAWSPSSFGQADDAPLRLLDDLGIQVRPNPYGRRLTAEEAMEHLRDVDGLIAGLEPLDATVLASAPRLKVIARVGIGVDNIDHEAAAAQGITVSNTPDPPAASVAELTITAALALLRGLLPASEALHRREWAKALTPGLRGTTVLLVGYGRIGQAVHQRLSSFGAEVLVTDPMVDPATASDVEFVSLDEGLSRARLVSLHAGGRTRLLGERELSLLPEGAFLLNSARGELVDEEALVAALDSGSVAGAWFDVFAEEPYSGPLCDYPQVLLTPHVGTYTQACRREMEMAATMNLLRDLGVDSTAVR